MTYIVSWTKNTGVGGEAVYDDLADAEIRFDEARDDPRIVSIELFEGDSEEPLKAWRYDES